MKKIVIPLSVLLFVAVTHVNAQEESSSYNTAVGIKFYPGALSIKHFVTNDAAIEGLASFWSDGFRVTGLYEFHHDISSVDGLKWYIGPGAHVQLDGSGYHGGGAEIGVDGVLGLDYKFTEAPINLSLDWQPSFSIGSYSGFYGGWGGLGLRYAF